jgi:WbqC-like protein family
MTIELQYLPNISYFACLLKYPPVQIEAQEHFVKQTYRNRCQILTANGIDTLIVPVIHTGKKMLIQEVKIDYSQNWLKRHWGAIVAAYSKAPYFEYFVSDFEQIYQQKPLYLFELNWQLLTLCLKLLRMNPPISLTEHYEVNLSIGQFDARSLIHPKKKIESNILDLDIVYQQNFGLDFVPNLSILDLLMCQGAMAKNILMQSIKVD